MKPAPQPGLVADLPIVEYHGSGHGISKSGLDAIHRSPATYHALYINPNRPPRKEKTGQLEGNLAHCAILEPDEWANRYRVGPDVTRSTKVWKDFAEGLPRGVTGIKPDQREVAMLQAQSVGRLPDIASALSRGWAEQSAFWIDEETGELCRCRPDWVHPTPDGGVILIDVKTFSDASGPVFRHQVARKRYHVQAAFYSDGYTIASGLPVHAFIFATVETEWPFLASATMLDEASMQQGRAEYRTNLNTFARCKARNDWPGYSTAVEILSLPKYALTETA